ncbi:unnamed protein product [Linum trigynum]|uniref:Uncharacterized protein n=1 Tax=Linum trigynum TaxID=586398 RepID=A0AAV2DDQ2_9ROSI
MGFFFVLQQRHISDGDRGPESSSLWSSSANSSSWSALEFRRRRMNSAMKTTLGSSFFLAFVRGRGGVAVPLQGAIQVALFSFKFSHRRRRRCRLDILADEMPLSPDESKALTLSIQIYGRCCFLLRHLESPQPDL